MYLCWLITLVLCPTVGSSLCGGAVIVQRRECNKSQCKQGSHSDSGGSSHCSFSSSDSNNRY
jgi:hypothetical protein